MKTIIKNGTIVTEEGVFRKDLLVKNGVVVKIADCIEIDGDSETEAVDAAGKLIFPGAVDVHTHMDLDVGISRAVDDFYDGTVAAVCGGTTTIVDHIAFAHGDVSLWEQVREYHKLADGKAVIDYGFHGVLQKMNETKLAEMAEIAREEGITSFKAYMTYGDNKIDDAMMLKVLKTAKDADIVIAVHCENDEMIESLKSQFGKEGKTSSVYHPLSRPAGAEAEAVRRFLRLAKEAGDAPVYIVHLSTAGGLREIQKAKGQGQKHIGVETCTQYLMFTDQIYAREDGLKYIMSPPLRKQNDIDVLWKALSEGGLLDVIATDHCPFNFLIEKQIGKEDFRKCPNGAPGVEERLIVLFSEGVKKGRMTLPQLVSYACANPAKMFGLYPKKGTLIEGSDADFVILDPEKKQVLTIGKMHGACDYTCYEGMEVTGRIERVYARGKLMMNDGRFLGKAGDGCYLKRGVSVLVSG